MWALGVVLFTMLYGQFPFYDNVPQVLFNKIKAADFIIPDDGRVSEDTRNLIRRLLVTDPEKRLTAAQVKQNVEGIILMWRNISPGPNRLQVVPQMEDFERESPKKIDYGPDNLLLNLGNHREFVSETSKNVTKTIRDGKNGSIPVHRLGEDARPLSAEEYRLYSQVITQMRGGRVKSVRQSSGGNQVLVRSDRLPGFQRENSRPNLSAPTTTSSLPATVPDQAEVLDLSQGPRREEQPPRSSVPPYLGQGMPAPSQTRPGVERTSTALSLVGALRRLGTRVNLVPISSESSSRVRSGSSRSSSARGEGGSGRTGGGTSSSRSSSRTHRHSSRSSHRDQERSRSRTQGRDHVAPSIVPAPILHTLPTSVLSTPSTSILHTPTPILNTPPTPVLSVPVQEVGVALPLTEATRLLGITLEPIPRLSTHSSHSGFAPMEPEDLEPEFPEDQDEPDDQDHALPQRIPDPIIPNPSRNLYRPDQPLPNQVPPEQFIPHHVPTDPYLPDQDTTDPPS